jgi:NTE family protein
VLGYTSIVVESRVSLALGGGAAKGLAHVGVLRGLEEDGIEVGAIAGTSMGSIVGALYARGMSGLEMEAFFASVDWARLGKIMLRSPGGGAFRDLLRETVGAASIEDMALPFASVCCNLETGEEVVIRRGSLADAVLASSSIPGILQPFVIDGQTLVDGAMVTPVPVETAAELDSAPVLAVNVLRPPAPGQTIRPVVKRFLEGAAPIQLMNRVEAFLDDHPFPIVGRKQDFPNRLEVVMRSFHVMQYNLAKQGEPAPMTVEPEVGSFGWFAFERAREIMAEGYRAYRATRSY